jgi:ABC-2 type transport system permease protein
MRHALHAEWTKLRTAPGTIWLLLGVIALTVAVSVAAAAAARCSSAGCGQDPAEAAILTGLMLAAGTIAVLASVLAGRLILPGHGFTPAHGYPPLSLGDRPVLRAAAGSVLYLALIALLSLGAAAAVRDSAAAVGVVLGLLYLFPIIAAVVTDPHWQRHLEQTGPMSAGLAIQATTGPRSLPSAPGPASAPSLPGPPPRSSPAACYSGCATPEPLAGTGCDRRRDFGRV